MKNSRRRAASEAQPPAAAVPAHGATELPSLVVQSYSLELRDADGFVGDNASQTAFRELLDKWRKRVSRRGDDPLGDEPSAELSKAEIDGKLNSKTDDAASDIVQAAIEEFAVELAHVIRRHLRQKTWKGVRRIVIGGGFPESDVGERAILQAAAMLHIEGRKIELARLRHEPDDGGVLGWLHLAPPEMLRDYDAILAVDIGGTNVRCGIVKPRLGKAADLSKAKVIKLDKWRHADDDPKQKDLLAGIVEMLERNMRRARRKGLRLAPFIGIGCPGLIRGDGSIARGAQNLPGDWERETFHLPRHVQEKIPVIDGRPTTVMLHNDAVVQGLSELPFMQDVERWGVLTIGTGLGNASFCNRHVG
ncbi:ROK family protein [Variovorax rhizosphaerae]|uniref:ROK family protein n=1 Tax=Variovorax rhizosphaerae TaxID=1836200 RepID=A0ABU8WQJ9_9BURK